MCVTLLRDILTTQVYWAQNLSPSYSTSETSAHFFKLQKTPDFKSCDPKFLKIFFVNFSKIQNFPTRDGRWVGRAVRPKNFLVHISHPIALIRKFSKILLEALLRDSLRRSTSPKFSPRCPSRYLGYPDHSGLLSSKFISKLLHLWNHHLFF